MTGDAPIRIYVNPKTKKRKWVSLHSINKRILQQLHTKGLKISGKGITVDSVVLLNKTTQERHNIWNTRTSIDSATNHNLELAPSLFQTVSKKDRILVYIDDIIDSSDEWEDTKPFPVYSTYAFLTSLLNEGSSHPKKIKNRFKGLVAYNWQNQNGEKIYIFWSNSDQPQKINLKEFNQNISVYNTLGKEIKGKEIKVSQSPVFIVENRN